MYKSRDRFYLISQTQAGNIAQKRQEERKKIN